MICLFGFCEEDFEVFNIYGRGGHLDHVSIIIPLSTPEAPTEKLKVSNGREYVESETIRPRNQLGKNENYK